MKIVWVEDDEAIRDCIKMIFKDVDIQLYSNWSEIPELQAGDICFHDWDGIGVMPPKVQGVHYFCVSGTSDCNVFVDFPKPFNPKDIYQVLKQVS